ncbi:MAG: hypothetical protein LKK07_10260 [Lactococcus lactis]|nr:hypothetical protein [Lactococcus lactis]MCI2139077.1 hypothetical protein [Lactococcus lactis]MCI2188860.1 hypothetical protein [Lactococcus lactis]
MSELENVKPVAFYRADWKGDMVFRKNNTIDVRKNESDFTKGWIKPLYDEIPEQPQLTIPKSIAEKADEMDFIDLQRDGLGAFQQFFDYNQHEYMDVIFAYLNPLTRDLVKVVEE